MNTVRLLCNFLTTVAFACSITLMSSSVYAKENTHIRIITSSNNNYQSQTATVIQKQLRITDISSSIISSEEIEASALTKNTTYVAIGQSAINRFNSLNIKAPLLGISNSAINDINHKSNHAHLILTQPACREIALIKSLNQDWHSIAILASTTSSDNVAELTKCAIDYGFNLSIYPISNEKDLARKLESAVENNDTLLAITDTAIYNRHTIKNILLTAYRNRRPIIGYSKSFIEAGAIAGIYTSPTSAGKQAAEIIINFLNDKMRFEKNIYYPNEFTVKTNRQVAKSLEISLPNDSVIRQSILNREQ